MHPRQALLTARILIRRWLATEERARVAQAITRTVQAGHHDEALAESERLAPLWALFAEMGGSFRVTAVIAEQLGLAG